MKRQCEEAEQKLRQEWQRSVVLEQQLEKAKLDSRKESSRPATNRSRTGSDLDCVLASCSFQMFIHICIFSASCLIIE